VEAPGIEPGSRCTSAPASTCVSGRWWQAEPVVFIPQAPASRVGAALTGCVF